MIRSTCACHTGTVAVMACGFGCALNWRNGAMAASRARLSHRFSPVDAALNTDSSAPLLGMDDAIALERGQQARWVVGNAPNKQGGAVLGQALLQSCLLYTSPSPR